MLHLRIFFKTSNPLQMEALIANLNVPISRFHGRRIDNDNCGMNRSLHYAAGRFRMCLSGQNRAVYLKVVEGVEAVAAVNAVADLAAGIYLIVRARIDELPINVA